MSNPKVTERDTKAAILAAYEELNAENKQLKEENEQLKSQLAFAQTPPRKTLAPGVLRLKQTLGLESPLWEKLQVTPDIPGANGEKARRLKLSRECFGGPKRQEAMAFMASIASAMEAEGHIPVFKGSYLRVVFRSAPHPPSDSHPDTPSFDSPEESI